MRVDEGVIKFEAKHEHRALAPSRYASLARELAQFRERLVAVGAIGQAPERYGGAGFGNVSARVGRRDAPAGRRAMLITGTQTGGRPALSLDDFCVVSRYDVASNRVESRGLVLPSSEAMTHGAIYDLSSTIRWVLHGHCPTLWRHARALGIPCTARNVAYGTPAMAREMRRLYESTPLAAVGVLAMDGHEDGVIAFGSDGDDTVQAVADFVALAAQHVVQPH
jgi:L-ribulose-5-phosphate 4-epimerase